MQILFACDIIPLIASDIHAFPTSYCSLRALSRSFSVKRCIWIRNHWHTLPPPLEFQELSIFFPFWTKPNPFPRGSFSSFHTKFSLKVLVSFFVYHDWFLTRISIFYFISHYTVKPFQTCVPSFSRLIRIHCSYCCETCGSYGKRIKISK